MGNRKPSSSRRCSALSSRTPSPNSRRLGPRWQDEPGQDRPSAAGEREPAPRRRLRSGAARGRTSSSRRMGRELREAPRCVRRGKRRNLNSQDGAVMCPSFMVTEPTAVLHPRARLPLVAKTPSGGRAHRRRFSRRGGEAIALSPASLAKGRQGRLPG